MSSLRLYLIYSKTGLIRFISHRDLMRIFFRGFSRISLPIRYSEGYSPHPRVTFCPPLKVGMSGHNEIMEIYLTGLVEPEEIIVDLNKVLPEGMNISEAYISNQDFISLGKMIKSAEYHVPIPESIQVNDRGIIDFMEASEINVEYKKKNKIKTINIRMGVEQLEIINSVRESMKLRMVLSVEINNRPYEVLSALSGIEYERILGLRWERIGFYGIAGNGRKMLLKNQIPIIYGSFN